MKVLNPSETHPPMGAAATISDRRSFTLHRTRRVSGLLVLGSTSTGAASDLFGASELAVKMVSDWGLSSRLGPIGYGGEDGTTAGNGYQRQHSRPYAEATQQTIDQEVSRMLSEAEPQRSHLLERNRKARCTVVALLLERETISGVDSAATVIAIRSHAQLHRTLAGP